MKKESLFMLFAGVALAGCVSEDVDVNPQTPVKLTFDSPVMYQNGGTRANFYGEIGAHAEESSGVSYSYPKAENFVIYAVQHEGDFSGWDSANAHEINGTTVKYDQSVDGWAPKDADENYYYWPEGKMSFAACSPADLELSSETTTRTYDKNGLSITNFEIQSDASKQYDLLFSTRTVNKTSADMLQSASYYSGIPIQFQHALSSIRFSIQNNAGTATSIVLKEIKVYGVKYKGNFTENITENAEDYSRYVREGANTEEVNVKPAWDVTNDILTEESAYIGFKGSVVPTETPQYVSSLANSDTDETNENEVSNQLILMPQTLTNDAIVKVTYTVNGHEHHKTALLKDGKKLNAAAGEDTNVTINAWNMGVRYTYRLVYGTSTADKDKIYFAPSTDKWEEHDVIVIEL